EVKARLKNVQLDEEMSEIRGEIQEAQAAFSRKKKGSEQQ
ncbi:GTP pyrophosphokinase, partial [Bacillus inaquosorum]|nr:GTP pyrophosphokinase [Bacillus inaquosorum]